MLKLTKISTNETLEFNRSIQMRLLSPLFYDQESFSYSFDIPATDKNNKILGFIKFPESVINSFSELFVIETPIFQMKGKLTITGTGYKNYQAYFVASTILDTMKETMVTAIDKEYDFSGLTNEEICDELHDSLDETKDYVCAPAENLNLYDGIPFNTLGKSNVDPTGYNETWGQNLNSQINEADFYAHNFEGDGVHLIGFRSLIVPFFYIKSIIREIFSLLSHTLVSNIFNTDADLKQLCFFNTRAINNVNIWPEGFINYPEYEITDGNKEENTNPIMTISGSSTYVDNNYVYIDGTAPIGCGWDNLIGKIFKIDNISVHSFMLLDVDSSSWDAFSSSVNLTAQFFPVVSLVTVDDPLQLQLSFDHNYVSGDYVYIRPWFHETGFSEGFYYRIGVVNNRNITLINFSTNLWPDCELHATISNNSGLYINLCTFSSDYDSIIMNRHLPDIPISDFIRELEKYLFVKFIFRQNNTCDIVRLKDVILDPDSEDITDFCSNVPVLELEPIAGFALGFTADDNDAKFEDIKEITEDFNVKDSVVNVVNLPESSGNVNNDVRLVTSLNEYYYLRKYVSGDLLSLSKYGVWQFFSINLFNKTIGDGSVDFVSQFSPVLWNMTNAGDIKIYFEKAVSVYSYRDLVNDNALRMFFYRGLNAAKPLPTGSVYGHNHVKLSTANLALEYDSQYGIYNVMGKDWINWNMNVRKDLKALIIWPAKYLNNFDFLKKRTIRGNKYFIKAIDFEIFNDEHIEFGETELARV